VTAICGAHLLYSQDNAPLAARYSHPALDEVNALVESRRYRKAIDLSLAKAGEMKQGEQWEGYIALMLRAAEIETFEVWKAKGFPEINIHEDYRRPLRYLDELHKYAGKNIEDYPALKANALFTQAVVYDHLNMPDTAEQMHLSALQLRMKIFGRESREVADSYLWLGVLYYWGLQRKELAEQNYHKARVLQEKYLPDSRYALGSVYYGLASIARENFKFDEVETMSNLYLSLYVDLPYEQAFAYQLVANMYNNQGNFEQSLQMRRKSLEIYETSGFREDLINGYSNLSSDLRALGRFEESRNALTNGLAIWEKTEPKDPVYAKILYEHLGDLYRMMKNYDSSEYYFDRAIQTAIRMFGTKNEELASVYDLRGRLFMDMQDYSKALEDFQQMLVSVIPDFHPANSLVIPAIRDESPYFFVIISAHFNKGDALTEWYKLNNNTTHLEEALDNYRTAYSQMLIARQTIGDDLSKPFLMSNFSESIENSIQCARILYEQTGEDVYFEDILHFVELTKYLNVLEARERAERANNSGIPKSLLFELEEVRNELNVKQRNKLTAPELAPDSARKINEEMVGLINRRRDLMTRISGYPGYTLSSIDSLLIDLDEIQERLSRDEQLLEYYWGRDSVYILSITGNSTDLASVYHDAATDTLITSVYRMISGSPSFGQAWVDNYSAWTSTIYTLFFKPLVSMRRLIVIPDGPLSLVPAEALVADHEPGKVASFRELNYLIYDHEISYAYSSSILFKNGNRNRNRIGGVLVFSYSGESGRSFTKRGNNLGELPGTYVELETLSRLFKHVTRFTNNEASKQNFINNTAGYDLIHLGVHGVGDEEVADNSHLIFRGDSLADRELYAYEIYNLNLDAGLVVLSACETGIGRNQVGEGVLSIARAFTYAGCPSVVMSLWDVRDIFTSDIMTVFYETLNQEQSVSGSLRNAKLQFLEKSDMFTAHPANWAAFVVNGQDLVFENDSNARYWFYLIAVSFLLVLIGLMLRYMQKRTRRSVGSTL
jgi:tetratricopeptide (TPR) repeat protein